MSLETAAEFLLLTAVPGQQEHKVTVAPRDLEKLSPRERELVALVASGCTDAQIASRLYISVSTVRSHLERIRELDHVVIGAQRESLRLDLGLFFGREHDHRNVAGGLLLAELFHQRQAIDVRHDQVLQDDGGRKLDCGRERCFGVKAQAKLDLRNVLAVDL